MAREPGYCLHKPSGKAYVNLGGKVFYLGVYGTDESKERYRALKAEWLLNRHAGAFKPVASSGPTMAELCIAYLEFAETYYSASTEYVNLELACRPVDSLYSTLLASKFDISKFEVCRDWWLGDPKRSRQYVNKQSKRLLRVLKWAAQKQMIRAHVYQECRLLAPLQVGRTAAPETQKVTCVAQSRVDATLPAMTQVLRDMVCFQQLVGCRPGELCAIVPGMVDRSENVWLIRLPKHKTAYRGKDRTIYVGPQAQKILAKYLLRAPDAACFSPIESEKQRLQAKHEARVTPLSYGNRPGSNRTKTPRKTPGASFDTGSYAHSIKGACRRAFPAPKDLSAEAKKKWHSEHAWSPNQLRHNAATLVRKHYGLEGAQVILGHSDIGISQVYAERDQSKAVSIALAIG
jgi:integrase